MKGNFHLKRGEVLKILVGQEGGVNTVSGGAGGGGGSFVVTDDNTPLLIGKCSVESFRKPRKMEHSFYRTDKMRQNFLWSCSHIVLCLK